MEDYKHLIEKKYTFISKKHDLEKELLKLEKEIKDINNQISIKCGENHLHSWIKEKECCYGGDTYIYCKLCGKDYYSPCIFSVPKPSL